MSYPFGTAKLFAPLVAGDYGARILRQTDVLPAPPVVDRARRTISSVPASPMLSLSEAQVLRSRASPDELLEFAKRVLRAEPELFFIAAAPDNRVVPRVFKPEIQIDRGTTLLRSEIEAWPPQPLTTNHVVLRVPDVTLSVEKLRPVLSGGHIYGPPDYSGVRA